MRKVGDEIVSVFRVMFDALLPYLDERQRRLAAGAGARALGHGGMTAVVAASGLSQATVSDGVRELECGQGPSGRVRRAGGGRKSAAVADPGLVPALLALIEPAERGDPMSPLRWTTKSLRTLAGELTARGHALSPSTVGHLLHEQGFSLQANAKTLQGTGEHGPDRDTQFRYINALSEQFLAAGDPVISVDAKKKEQVGNFANAGRTWRPAGDPVRVRDHDFLDEELGKVVPYGVYDVAADAGWVNVGVDGDTAEFAVESIRRWWNGVGRETYPRARRLLITADAGGSNAARSKLWKARLADLALQSGLAITVCHLPPGTSKWNKIEHRLFSHISMNWRGRPLTSHEVVLRSIGATSTATGLRVRAELDTAAYPTGIEICPAQAAALPVTGHRWRGEWNYTVRPEAYTYAPDIRRPFNQPGPVTAALCHSAVTGLSDRQWLELLTQLEPLHERRRTTAIEQRRAGRTSPYPPRPARVALTLPDRLLATVLRRRHRLPVTAIAALFEVSTLTIYHNTDEIDRLLKTLRHPIPASRRKLKTLDDLNQLTATAGTALSSKIKLAC